jgi:hypothetical protein
MVFESLSTLESHINHSHKLREKEATHLQKDLHLFNIDGKEVFHLLGLKTTSLAIAQTA